MGMERYRIGAHPETDPKSVISGKNYRISVLTEALVRFEYSENGLFEDRPTQKVLNRDFETPDYHVSRDKNGIHIFTGSMEIHYDEEKFSPGGLMIRVAGGRSSERLWRYGDKLRDLGGTARTLDTADGAIPLESGLMSKAGFSVMDDTGSMAILPDGTVTPRSREAVDFYFWAYGHRYLDCLKAFYHLCGKQPLLPRFVFGNWWSRYHRYDEAEYKELVERFEKEGIPFSVAVIDMDWHLVQEVDPRYGSGWTGYTWNPALFPDPKEFMDWLHAHGMKTTLNLHPADGIRAYEKCYPEIARRMGIDPESGDPVQFDVTDPQFLEAYFETVLHPMEEEGVDFWWIDWQQGNTTKIEGLDPLWMLNHYHYLDSRRSGARGLTFSRYAGPGSHRYPVGFSGDTVISWDSLAFQPYFTANASNIGYGWWSHDIGGHMRGVRDDDLTVRWVQLGVFSPINRLHSTDNPFNGKEPWKYNDTAQRVMTRYLRLRHALIPYLYSMNHRAWMEDEPLIQPMYYREPEREETYGVPNNYYFGTELMVSPITEPNDREMKMGKAATWIPEGIWYDFFTGRKYRGGRKVNLWRTIEDIPVLAKAGAIVPLDGCSPEAMGEHQAEQNPQKLKIRVFAGGCGRFDLWEDDGVSAEECSRWAKTTLTLSDADGDTVFTVSAAEGETAVLPEKRDWTVCFVNCVCDTDKKNRLRILADGVQVESFEAEQTSGGVVVAVSGIPVKTELQIRFEGGLQEAAPRIEEEVFSALEQAQISYDLKAELYDLVCRDGSRAVATIIEKALPRALEGFLVELLTAE